MDWLLITLGVVWIVTTAYIVVMLRRKPTDNVFDEVGELIERSASIYQQVRILVVIAQELWESGEIPEDGRLEFVLKKLKELYPAIAEQRLTFLIESQVDWLKVAQRANQAPQIRQVFLDGGVFSIHHGEDEEVRENIDIKPVDAYSTRFGFLDRNSH